MLPSRGPIQVTLEDAGTVKVQPSKLPAQVRILRRPTRPDATLSTNIQEQSTTSTATATAATTTTNSAANTKVVTAIVTNNFKTSSANNHNQNVDYNNKEESKRNNSNDVFEERLLTDSTTTAIVTGDGLAKNQNALKKESNKPPPARQTISYLQAASSVHNNNNNNSLSSQCNGLRNYSQTQMTADKQQSPSTSSLSEQVPSKSSAGNSGNSKKVIKTYQERADEYAKARLRILGSAFPESEDGNLTNVDDVNRILNLDSTSSTRDTLSDRNRTNGLADSHTRSYAVYGQSSDNRDSKGVTNCYFNNNRNQKY